MFAFMLIVNVVFISFIISFFKKEADYFLSTTIATSSRVKKVDFPSSWAYAPFSTLLPYPRETLDMAASFKPLSYEVYFYQLMLQTN